ncbi:MAG: uracil-DNA glycosylase [Candidatus Paceibacteria bacterium]
MKEFLPKNWSATLTNELDKPYFMTLTSAVRESYRTDTTFPTQAELFSAFTMTPFSEVKVVILGQDPYHGPGQAHGLAFSVQDGVAVPPSLLNIYKEIKEDIGTPIPNSGNLTHWAKQGVLLLNSTLSGGGGAPRAAPPRRWGARNQKKR